LTVQPDPIILRRVAQLDPISLAGKTIEFGGPAKLNFFESGSPIRLNILGSDFIVENQIFFFYVKTKFSGSKTFFDIVIKLENIVVLRFVFPSR
jgi:hypothetical protein